MRLFVHTEVKARAQQISSCKSHLLLYWLYLVELPYFELLNDVLLVLYCGVVIREQFWRQVAGWSVGLGQKEAPKILILKWSSHLGASFINQSKSPIFPICNTIDPLCIVPRRMEEVFAIIFAPKILISEPGHIRTRPFAPKPTGWRRRHRHVVK